MSQNDPLATADPSPKVDGAPNDQRVSVLANCAHGELDALQQTVTDYGALVWWLAERFTGATADEATQEVFLTIWRNAGAWQPQQQTEAAFVVSATRQTLIDLRRRFALEPHEPDESDAEDAASSLPELPTGAHQGEQVQAFAKAVHALSPVQHATLIHAVHEVDHVANIARTLEATPDSVRVDLYKTFEQLETLTWAEATKASTLETRPSQLLLDEVTQGLNAADRAELDWHLEHGLEGCGNDMDAQTGNSSVEAEPQTLIDLWHSTAAMLQLQLLTESSASAKPTQLPALIEADVRQLAKQEAKRTKSGTQQPIGESRLANLGLSPAWWVAVAALFLALLGWWPRFPFVSTVTAPRTSQERAAPPRAASTTAQLSQLSDTVTIVMAPTNDEAAAASAQWNQRLGRGALQIDGLQTNSPEAFRYQVLVYDQTEDGMRQVKGGTFDVKSQRTQIVPIQPEQEITQALGFAVTGGNVRLEGRFSP